ncbi:MAG TPA: APC family permease [Candidatus Bathyarchaeia archaeon]|nr:APC family permease [Candidatus Bathyarchaeia archaeon]
MAKQTSTRRLRRNIGILGNFAFGYADVAEGIYFTLGLVVIYAGAAATYAYLLATIAYVLTALCYAELASLYHQAGGAFVYARRAFGPNIAFLAAWALLLDYVVTTAISALAAMGYLSYFFPKLNEPLLIGSATAAAIILLVGLNIFGLTESAKFSYFLVLFNIAGMATVLVAGYLFSYHPGLNTIQFGTSPTYHNFLYAITIAMSSYLGIEVISQSAGETRRPAKNIPRAVFLISAATVIAAISFSTLAVGVRSVQDFQNNPTSINDPVAFIAQAFPNGWIFASLASFLGVSILLVASNAGIVGSSRIGYAMSQDGVIPRFFGRLHGKYSTPFVSIILFSAVSVALAFSGELGFVAELYNFGALFAYVIVGLSLISLRNTDRALFRPFKTPGSITIPAFWKKAAGSEESERYTIPIIGVLCVIADLTIWLLVVILHPLGRIFGTIWMGAGLLVFFAYTRFRKVQPSETDRS